MLSGATWCGPCKMISPHFEKAEAAFENVVFVKVDVDEQPVRSVAPRKWQDVAAYILAFALASFRRSPRNAASEPCPLSWLSRKERRSAS